MILRLYIIYKIMIMIQIGYQTSEKTGIIASDRIILPPTVT